MATPQQVLEDARWILNNTSEAIEVIYDTIDEHWYLRLDGVGEEDNVLKFKTEMTLRDVETLKKIVRYAQKWRSTRTYLQERADKYVTFTKQFLEHPKAKAWLSGAAWAAHLAADIKFAGPDAHCDRWIFRTAGGHFTLGGTVDNRVASNLQHYMEAAHANGKAMGVSMWVNREFLEEWFKCEQNVSVTKAPETAVQVTASVTTEAVLPADLQGHSHLKGQPAEARRQSHKASILQDMLTRTASPRYR